MSTGDMVVVAVFAACGGGVLALAGFAGLRQSRRIERSGIKAWALVKRSPGARDDEPSPPRPLLQFTTEDGRVVEIVSPVPATRRRPLRDGDTLLITYDPADPATVVVHNRERRLLDYGFIAAGALVALLALLLVGLVAR
ncbi:DUF3592 domain-containing protein [Streptomyces gibsoniae]|uniref:DUF3592 domain-containing protein n=1 Tax=Streptomyces gibsoniae TaxID=3075529 RepID=A0ABU2TUF5_9ACTN|nr:DUF3592 domain-containing protein [Streptomyces sp. DSM 41699]MDT0464601.1 DUF3592 domain-containing protein [Streptomyces sp. DSM 41699]